MKLLCNPAALDVNCSSVTVNAKLGEIQTTFLYDTVSSVSQYKISADVEWIRFDNLRQIAPNMTAADMFVAQEPVIGEYNMKITFYSDSKKIGMTDVPMHVDAGVGVSPKLLHFGFIPIGNSSTRTLIIDKKTDIVIHNVHFTGFNENDVSITYTGDEKNETSKEFTIKAIAKTIKVWNGTVDILMKNKSNSLITIRIPIQGGGY